MVALHDRLEEAISVVCRSLRFWQPRPVWRHCSDELLYRELVACLLGSRVPFLMAAAAATRLQREGLLIAPGGRAQLPQWERVIVSTLSTTLGRGYPHAYRFPHLAGRRLTRLAARLPGPADLRRLLRSVSSSHALRMLFVGLRCGMGPKQTSLFLRNVGWSWDVAILDVHVLSYMRLSNLASENSVPTLTAYERLEDRLRAYALGRGEPLGRLDFAVWLVMRAAKKEKGR